MDKDNFKQLEQLVNIIYKEISIKEDNNFKIYKNFKNKAFKHIYYLKIIMFIFTCILYEFKVFDKLQLTILIFIILFNLAFTQNMLNNLVLDNSQNKILEDAKNNIINIKKDLLL